MSQSLTTDTLEFSTICEDMYECSLSSSYSHSDDDEDTEVEQDPMFDNGTTCDDDVSEDLNKKSKGSSTKKRYIPSFLRYKKIQFRNVGL